MKLSAHQQVMADMLTEIHNSVVKIRKKEARKQQKVSNEIACENPKLLELVFGDFLESVAIHFDEIFNLLVEDLLVDEVNNLNYIENKRSKDIIRKIEVENSQNKKPNVAKKQKKINPRFQNNKKSKSKSKTK